MGEHTIRVERTLAGGSLAVWTLLADTNRWDRALGLASAAYSFREAPDGTRERVASAKLLGFPVEWVEPPYQWVEGVFVAGHRRYLSGPITRAGLRCEVFSVDKRRTRVVVSMSFTAPALMRPVLLAATPVFTRAIEAHLGRVDTLLAQAPPEEGDVERARDAMLMCDEPALRGATTPAHEEELARRAEDFSRDPRVGEGVRDKLLEWVRRAPDDDVESMRPFALARLWNISRATVLQAFLVATRTGLIDLRWKLLCPVCRTGADTARTLAEVGRRVRCDACGRDYDVDFSEHVEAVFSPNAAVRSVDVRVWCASSAWRRPHVMAQVTLEPGASLRANVLGFSGTLGARVSGTPDVTPLPVGEGVSTKVTVTAGLEAWPVVTDESGPSTRHTELVFVNRRDKAVTLQIERMGAPPDALTGRGLLLFPDYIDLFATDAPARGVELSVGAVAVLFTDLTGSTALYERVGDARAFGLVEQHFREMSERVAAHGGTVVKTMGDAVMAVFPKAVDAVKAAVEMARMTAKEHGGDGVSLKLGVHQGPCLAVRANDRLDFFGTTVNVAARLQSKADAHELVVMEALLRNKEVAEALEGMPRRSFTASLKGIRQEQHLLAVDVREKAGA